MSNFRDAEAFVGKNAVVEFTKNGETESVRCVVEKVNDLGVMLKRRGRSTSDIILAEEFVSVAEDTEAVAKDDSIKSKPIKPVEAKNVRKHLADRHGVNLEQVNALTDEQAVQIHNQLHESDAEHKTISHFHDPKAGEKKAAKPVAAAPASPGSEV